MRNKNRRNCRIKWLYFSISLHLYRRALLSPACPCNKMSLTCLWWWRAGVGPLSKHCQIACSSWEDLCSLVFWLLRLKTGDCSVQSLVDTPSQWQHEWRAELFLYNHRFLQSQHQDEHFCNICTTLAVLELKILPRWVRWLKETKMGHSFLW